MGGGLSGREANAYRCLCLVAPLSQWLWRSHLQYAAMYGTRCKSLSGFKPCKPRRAYRCRALKRAVSPQVTIRFDDGTVVTCHGSAMEEYAEDVAIMPLDEADDLFLDEDHYHLHLGVHSNVALGCNHLQYKLTNLGNYYLDSCEKVLTDEAQNSHGMALLTLNEGTYPIHLSAYFGSIFLLARLLPSFDA